MFNRVVSGSTSASVSQMGGAGGVMSNAWCATRQRASNHQLSADAYWFNNRQNFTVAVETSPKVRLAAVIDSTVITTGAKTNKYSTESGFEVVD